jgi:DNA-binding CsgD family transcriptional regulator
MQQIVRNYLEASEFARSPDDLRDAIGMVVALLDCHGFAYLTLPDDMADTPYLLSNYDVRWTTQYQARRDHLRDPVTRQARRVNELFAWTPEIAARFDPAARDLFCESEAFGIRCGVTVPLRHSGRAVAAMTLVTDVKRSRYLSFVRCNVFALQLLAQNSHERLQHLRREGCEINGVVFTRRETECLEWASQGKSRTDIALITRWSYRQVVRALEHAKAKLGVRTTTQAVRIYAAHKANRGTT